MIMSLAQYDFGGKIFWRTAQRECPINYFLRKPKVSYLQVSIRSDEHVLWLQVPVGNLFTVQILQGEHYLRGVKQCNIIWEKALPTQ